MFTAAISAPAGVSAKAHARPLRRWRGPAADEVGSSTRESQPTATPVSGTEAIRARPVAVKPPACLPVARQPGTRAYALRGADAWSPRSSRSPRPRPGQPRRPGERRAGAGADRGNRCHPWPSPEEDTDDGGGDRGEAQATQDPRHPGRAVSSEGGPVPVTNGHLAGADEQPGHAADSTPHLPQAMIVVTGWVSPGGACGAGFGGPAATWASNPATCPGQASMRSVKNISGELLTVSWRIRVRRPGRAPRPGCRPPPAGPCVAGPPRPGCQRRAAIPRTGRAR